MLEILSAAFLSGLIAGLITNLLVPVLVRIAESLRALDVPDAERKLQQAPIPRLGGVAIVVGVAMGAGGMAMAQWADWGFTAGRSELVALAIGVLLVFLVGVVDDLQGVSAAQKLLVEVAAAWLIVRVGWGFSVLGLPFIGPVDLGLWGPLLSIGWIVGITNAINLIDGLDGLAGGVVAIISGSFLIYAVLQQNLLSILLLGGMVGACLGFLRHNWAPAKIYMGDSGALTLGFLLAVMSVHASLKAPAAVAILVPLLALGLPIIDTLVVIVVRFLERPKMRPVERVLRVFQADRNHLHHLLEAAAPFRGKLVLLLYGLVLAFCLVALVVAWTGNQTLGLWLVAGEVVVIVFVRLAGLKAAAHGVAVSQMAVLRSEVRPEGGSAPVTSYPPERP